MTPSDEVLVKWYEARDAFMSINRSFAPEDDREERLRGLQLADEVKNEIPEAKWLCELFPERSRGITRVEVFGRLGVEWCDRRNQTAFAYTKCMAGSSRSIEDALREAPHPLFLGVILMLSWCEGAPVTATKLRVAEQLAAQREPRGFFYLWHEDVRRVDCLKRAAELGLVVAWRCYGGAAFSRFHPEHYLWIGRAAQCGHHRHEYLEEEVATCLLGFLRGATLPSSCIAQIGALFGTGALSVDRVRQYSKRENTMHSAAMCYILTLCKNWRADARRAVNTWLAIGRRLRVIKDIRGVIGKRVWNEWMQDVEYVPVHHHRAAPFPITEDHVVVKCSMHFQREK